MACVVMTGEVAPLECNLDALAGISYTKGCYIGQERNSYTHYRGIIRKRMMPVALPGLEPSAREAQEIWFVTMHVWLRVQCVYARSLL
jgi:folate-binding protein YgfZ